MNLADVRDELAAAAASHAGDVELTGYREPGGEYVLPAFVVLDPGRIGYHVDWGPGRRVELRARVIVPYTTGGDVARPLDALLSSAGLVNTLERYATDVWDRCTVVEAIGPYTTYTTDDGHLIGVSADLQITIE